MEPEGSKIVKTVKLNPMNFLRRATAVLGGVLFFSAAHGQCNNNLYAMSYLGVISSVNTTNAGLTAISGAAPSANMANALAYAGGATPTFYFFANSNAGSLVFESYVPS